MADLPYRMAFVISAPRSGSTMVERMLESHSRILGGPEPHLLTPLAHLGVWDQVDKAPYDHILAAEAQKLFVRKLPEGEEDYWRACRAYCDVLYGRYLEGNGRGEDVVLDKTPAYALALPFIAKVFPEAAYVVLTRHPAAVFSSFANSFFDGDYAAAHAHNPLLERYLPALAAFLRRDAPAKLHIRYEDLVGDPEGAMREICAFMNLPFEAEIVDYGTRSEQPKEGLGDPTGVHQHARPTADSLAKWAQELTADPGKLAFMREVIDRLEPDDLETLGYPIDTLWDPLETFGEEATPAKRPRLTRYRLQRKAILGLRNTARRRREFRKLVEKARLACDVILREE